ncbi:hypothetical protein BEST7613_6054 [Synechocystis sp. PCC 6803]|nr:hypothetical protein BEST7613_6054 [Synechocystis sp. PCC 6803] [Bacillus subtilis BEST7613]
MEDENSAVRPILTKTENTLRRILDSNLCRERTIKSSNVYKYATLINFMD